MTDLKNQLAEMREKAADKEDEQIDIPGDLWGCKFNAGLFAVEWGRTKKVLEDAELPMTIVKFAGE